MYLSASILQISWSKIMNFNTWTTVVILALFTAQTVATVRHGWTGECYASLSTCSGIIWGFRIPGMESCAQRCRCGGFVNGMCAQVNIYDFCPSGSGHGWICVCYGRNGRNGNTYCRWLPDPVYWLLYLWEDYVMRFLV